jgi:diguanylate cyclase (GGDEF)-like protein/PAS domain S-box-containing protein
MVTNSVETTTHRLPNSRSRRLWVPYVVSVAIIVTLVIALAGMAVLLEKQRYRERAATATENIATLLDTHISDVLDNIDSDLKTAVLYYREEANRGPVDGNKIYAFIQKLEAQQNYLENLRILDKEGYLRYDRDTLLNKPIDASDRPYFLQARDNPNANLIVYGPVQSRVTGKWVMILARRLSAPDGRFAGVVYASLATAQFDKTFSSIKLGAHGAATLRTTDLALVHRVPDTKNAIGSKEVSKQLAQTIQENPQGGQYLAKTAIDGVERSNAYRRLQRYPFYVIVGLATYDYLGGWQMNAAVVAVLAGLTILLTGFAGWRTYRAQSFAESNLQRERELKAAIVESSEDAIIAKSPEGVVTSWNAGAEAIFGYTAKEMVGQATQHLYPAELVDEASDPLSRLSVGTTVQHLESAQLRKDGERIHISSTISPLRNERGQIVGEAIISRDITKRKKDETQLRLAASVFTHAHEGIVITDADVRIVDVNSMYEQITGFSRDELLGKNPHVSRSGRQTREFYEEMWRSLMTRGHWDGEIWNRRKSGEFYAALLTISTVRNAHGDVQNYVGILSDITQLKDYQQHLEYVAHHDPLTDLPNRMLFADRLNQAIAQSRRRSQALAVVYLDLDGFKEVNDTHGHGVGDDLLIVVARRMKEVLRGGDTLARLGGDEFVGLLVDFDTQDQCVPVLHRLLESVAEPITIGTHQLQRSASLGVAFYPDDAADADQLMRHADQAMYVAKQRGKNRMHWFGNKADGVTS